MRNEKYENKRLRRREFVWPARYTAPLCVRIQPEVKARLDAMADERGISVGQIVRRALLDFLGMEAGDGESR